MISILPAPGGPINIILTLSCAADEPPPCPDNLPSSSAMRCSSLWTVPLSSSTTESVIGAIVPGCEGADVLVYFGCVGAWMEYILYGEGRNGSRKKTRKTELGVEVAHVGRTDSFRAGKMGRARGYGAPTQMTPRQKHHPPRHTHDVTPQTFPHKPAKPAIPCVYLLTAPRLLDYLCIC
jgi:hypothetical protein